MTAKDLNFSFDRNPVQAAGDHFGQPESEGAPEMKAASPVPVRRKKRQANAATTPRSGSRQWVATACIALVNMLFLVLAGIWLSGFIYPAVPVITPAGSVAAAELDPALMELKARLGGMEQQMGDLQVAVARQQQTIVSAHLAMEKRLDQLLAQPAVVAEPPPTVAGPPQDPTWYINLGEFPGRKEAVALQQRIRELGHQAQIRQQTEEGRSLYQVMLPGFSDRAAADQVAMQIMEQSSLNGLWVGSGD